MSDLLPIHARVASTRYPAAASGANADAGPTSPRDDQSPPPASEPAMTPPEPPLPDRLFRRRV